MMIWPSCDESPPLQILHVDDHPMNRRLVRDILTACGHQTIQTCLGAEVLEQAALRSTTSC